MDFKEIKELMAEFNSSPMRELEIETEGFHIHLSKNENTFKPLPAATNTKAGRTPVPANNATDDTKQETIPDETYITAPMVGSIYLQPEPDKPAYVEIGSRVHKGDVVCIIEAMKMMTEIKADVDGVVTKVLVANEELVEFGQQLFEIQEG